MGRHLWPGLAAYRIADGTASAYTASEIAQQLAITRAKDSPGAVLYNTTAVRLNRGGVADLLRSGPYAAFALPPSYPWIDGQGPAAPTQVAVRRSGGTLRASWERGVAESDLRWWLVRWRAGGAWFTRLVPQERLTFDIPAAQSGRTDAVAVAAVDAAGNLSAAALWR